MGILHTVYGLHVGDTRYRSKLKVHIKNEFKDKPTFLDVGNNVPEILIDSSIPASEVSFKDKTGCIIKTAEYLRAEILSHAENLSEICWPPQLDELLQDERSPPPSLILFVNHKLQQSDKKNIRKC